MFNLAFKLCIIFALSETTIKANLLYLLPTLSIPYKVHSFRRKQYNSRTIWNSWQIEDRNLLTQRILKCPLFISSSYFATFFSSIGRMPNALEKTSYSIYYIFRYLSKLTSTTMRKYVEKSWNYSIIHNPYIPTRYI